MSKVIKVSDDVHSRLLHMSKAQHMPIGRIIGRLIGDETDTRLDLRVADIEDRLNRLEGMAGL